MDKSFICLVSCKPYDDLQEVIEGIKLLKEGEESSLQIEPYLALADFDQLSEEEKGLTPDIRYGTSVVCYNGGSSFASSVESQILKDKKAQFVFVGDGENRSIQQKLKSSVQAGLPVILSIQGQDSIEPLKEQLETYLGELDENERAEVTIVYQPATVKSKQEEEKEIRTTLERCRAILEEIGGEAFAEQVKILYEISKYTPELLKSCLKDQIDGVCIYPKILPKKEIKAVQEPVPEIIEEEIEETIVEPVIEKREPVVVKKKAKSVEHLLKENVEGTCLVFCHPYEDHGKTMQEMQNSVGNAVDCLFALPFTSLNEVTGSEGIECGVWGLSLTNTGHLSYDVHFEMIKENHASFIVIGDRFRRDILNVRGAVLNQQLLKAIQQGIRPLLGVTHTKDIKKQLERALLGISASEAVNIGYIFYAGLFGNDLTQEAEQIEKKMDLFRQTLSELYDEETAQAVNVFLEISHFSEDPFAFLTLRSVNGISLSASAIKQGRMSKIPQAAPETEEAVIEEEEKVLEEEPQKEEVITEPQIREEEEEILEEIPEQEEIFEDNIEEVVESAVEEELVFEQVDRPIETVKAVVGASAAMSEEEMSDWAEANPVQGTGEKVDVEYEEVERTEAPSTVDIEEGPEPVIAEEEMEEPATSVNYEATTVEEGLQLVKLTVDECAERLASKHFQETYIPSDMDLESPDVKLERMKMAYRQKYEDFRDHAALGWDILFEEMEHNQVPDREAIINVLDLPLDKILQFTDVEGMSAELNKDEGKVWYEVIGLTKDQMTKLYETARGLFEKKRYKDAADAFFTLISLNAKEYGMWFGYGMAKKLEKENLELALDAFSIANTLLPGKAEPFIHAAECYIELGDRSEAERCLTHGKKLIGEDSQYLKEWAEHLEEQL